MRDMRYRNSLRTHQKTTQDTAPTRREVEYTQPPAHKTSSPLHTVIDKRIQSSFVNLKKAPLKLPYLKHKPKPFEHTHYLKWG